MTCLTSQWFLFCFFTHYCTFANFSVLVCTCFSLHLSSYAYFDVFVILQSFRQSVPPHGSAEQPTSTGLVPWLVHNSLIAWPASPHRRFYSVVSHTTAFSPFFMFEFAHILACICHLFPCFHPFTIFPYECASAWLSRTIHQHTFSHLAGALFTDCMTCLTSQTFLFCFFTHYCIFASFPIFQFAHVWVYVCLHMLIPMFSLIYYLSVRVCPHMAQQRNSPAQF